MPRDLALVIDTPADDCTGPHKIPETHAQRIPSPARRLPATTRVWFNFASCMDMHWSRILGCLAFRIDIARKNNKTHRTTTALRANAYIMGRMWGRTTEKEEEMGKAARAQTIHKKNVRHTHPPHTPDPAHLFTQILIGEVRTQPLAKHAGLFDCASAECQK